MRRMLSPNTRITLSSLKLTVLLAVVLCLSAGTIRYWQAWLYLALQLVGMTLTNLYMMRYDPALLRRRLIIDEGGEKEPVQRRVMAVNRLLGLAMLVLAGLDRRFGWSAVPTSLVVAGCALFVVGSCIVFLVFRENTFTSSIIEVDAGQTVVRSGPYRLVRHPMYAGALVMGLATPIALGSFWAEIILPISFVVLAVRVLAEERFLTEKLAGYREYLEATRSRIVPGVW